jgi:hypothetical protein
MGLLHFCIECRNDLSIIEGGQSYIHIVSLGPVMTPNLELYGHSPSKTFMQGGMTACSSLWHLSPLSAV